jgi:uncharacterized repeat protein (TIGR03803 family)
MKKTYLFVATLFSFLLSINLANAQLGQLWGVTSTGGANNGGVLYFFDPGNGKDSIVCNFPSNSDPEGTPMQAKDGNIYGTSRVGGSGGYGYIYQYNPVTATFTVKASFGGGASGSNPYCTLIQSSFDGNLYGTTESGGAGNYGTIFQYNISTNTLSVVYAFNGGTLGSTPYSGVVEGTSGTLYGTTYGGGANSKGTLYKYALSPGTYTNLYSFAAASGSLPYGTPYFASDGNLYGMTSMGGGPNGGVVYKWTIAGSTYAQIANLPSTSNPEGCFVGSGSTLYGLTGGGGSTGNGTIMSCTTGGTVTTLYNFGSPPDGGIPRGNLCFASDGNLYGVTSLGGSSNKGIMFKTSVTGSGYTDLFSFTGPNGYDPNYNSSVIELMSVGIKESEPGCSTQALTAMPRGYAGTLTYSWSTGATTSSITATAAGTYTVTATDGRGITVSNTFSLPVNYSALSASATGGNVSCNGGSDGYASTDVSGGVPPFSYQWSSGATTTSIGSITAGNYTYTVTDVNGCTATATYTVGQPAALTVTTSGGSPICIGNSTTITAIPSGGTAPYGYTWAPNTGLAVPTGATVTANPSSTQTYTVTVTDGNNCTAYTPIVLTVNPLPNVTANFTSSPICLGNNTMLTASGANSYVWSPAATLSASVGTSVTATPTMSTTYSVIGTDGNGCQSTGTTPVVVNTLPAVTVAPTTQAVCAGNAAPMTASGANTYTWSPATGLNFTTGSNVSATPATSKTYTVTGTNSTTGCQNTATSIVTVNALPTVTASPSVSPICHGSSSTLTASGATSYTWAPATTLNKSTGSSVVATPTISTTYTVTGTNASGCTNTGTVVVVVNALPTVTASAGTSPICNGSGSLLTASGATTYTWTPSASLSSSVGTSVTATPTISTTYTVTGTNAAGCTNTGTVAVVVNALPTVTASSNSPICSGNTATLSASGATTYTWTPSAGLNSSTGSGVSGTPTGSTTYTVTGTNAAGCTNSTTVSFVVNSLPTVTASASASPICNGSGSNLTAGGATSYTWAPATTLSKSTGSSVVATPTISTTYTVTGTNASGCVNTATVAVVVNQQPTVTVNESPTAICLGNSSTLTATASGGTGPYTYSWAPATDISVTTGNVVSASPGTTYTYTVTIMDANGCSNTASAPIIVNYAPGLSFTPTSATICLGGNTGITVSGANSYVWSPGSSLNCSNCATVNATPTVNTVYKVTGTSAAGCASIDSVSVFVNPLPTITASASSPIICIGSNSTLTANGATSYTWAPMMGLSITTGASVLATPTTSVTYTVTGTNGGGCQSTQTVSVTINPLPTVSASATTNPICKGSPTAVTASGASTYTWSPSTGLSTTMGSSVNANPASAITYTVTGTDGNGCVSSGTLAMSVNSLPTISANASPTAICSGSTSSLSGGGAVSYVWSPAATLNISTGTVVTASPTTTTAYTVTGTDGNGCSNTANVVVDVDNPIINLTKANVSCHGACNGTLLPNVSGGTPPYSYSWSNSQTTALASNLCPATYTLTLTDNLGCSGSKSATITQPGAISVNGSSTATSCGLANGIAIASASGGSAPYNYSWNTSPVQTGNTISNLASGSYSVTVTDGNGCTAGTNVTVGASSGPAISVSNLNQSGCGKNDGNATISVTGGTSPYLYSWNNGGTTAADTGLAAGTYIATVTDNNGCSTFKAITISDASAPAVNITSVTEVNCNGASSGAINTSTTGGTPPYQYSWSNNATTQNINSLTAGPYQISVADANGCTTVQTINITQPNQLIVSTAATPASCGSSDGSVSVTVSGGTTPYTYSWNSGVTTSSLANSGAGTYTVTVTDKNGCFTLAQASISNTSGPLVTIDSVINVSCSTGSTGEITEASNGGTPPYTYAWSNGTTTANDYGLAAGNYALTVTDASGCVGTANATIKALPLDTVPICMVTVDPATNFNNLIWNINLASPKAASVNIYKETTTPGVFGKIGSAPVGKGLYIDTLSDARKRSWRYELSQVDSCGNESPLSKPFKTMHLTINLGASNSINLIWDNFQGVAFNYYIVYRDSIAGVAKDSIDYVTNNGNFTYTDYPPTNTNWYYHMGISGGADCSSPVIKPHSIEAINYNASKSNTGSIIFVGPTAVSTIAMVNNVEIFPNPNTGVFNLSIELANMKQNVGVKIINTMGQVISSSTYNEVSGSFEKKIDLSGYSKGIYFVQVTTSKGTSYHKVAVQ